MAENPGYDAVILTGGAGRRLGGADKAMMEFEGSSSLARVLAAVTDAERRICVGPERPTETPVLWTIESPPGGGPVAGTAAGLALVEAPTVVLLAVDLPLVTRALIGRLLSACGEGMAALAVDPTGRVQPLLAAYPTALLRERLRDVGEFEGASMRSLLESMPVIGIEEDTGTRDYDTWYDVVSIEAHFGGR